MYAICIQDDVTRLVLHASQPLLGIVISRHQKQYITI